MRELTDFNKALGERINLTNKEIDWIPQEFIEWLVKNKKITAKSIWFNTTDFEPSMYIILMFFNKRCTYDEQVAYYLDKMLRWEIVYERK